MLIIAFLMVAFNHASSAPVLPPTTDFGPTTPLTIFGRELPDCVVNVTRDRAVQDILRSCAATIFACTWVAVHPNVPMPEDTGWKRLKQRVVIMFYAILTPEFVIMWAARQRIGAAEHMKNYNKKFYQEVTLPSHSTWWYIKCWFRGPGDEKQDGRWTITHGFLLEMHGLVDCSGKTICNVQDIPDVLDISEEEINDRSKGDFLTKLLVVLQTTWFIVQCFARWIIHLPVTELEIVTLAFALLNIGTYSLWWNKPQNMHIAARTDQYWRPKGLQEQKMTTEANKENAMLGTSSKSEQETPSEDTEEQDVGEGRCVGIVHGTSSEGGGEQSVQGDSLLRSESSLEDQPNQRFGFLGRAAVVAKECVCGLDVVMSTVITGLRLHRQLRRSLTFRNIINSVSRPILPLFIMAANFHCGNECDRIFYSSIDLESYPRTITCFLLVATAFGGLHLVPLWSSSFPSSNERFLWQLSAGSIIAAPIVNVCGDFFRSSAPLVVRRVLEICSGGLGGLYLIARFILIILAFTTLRKLPPDAFQNIAWTTLLPHF